MPQGQEGSLLARSVGQRPLLSPLGEGMQPRPRSGVGWLRPQLFKGKGGAVLCVLYLLCMLHMLLCRICCTCCVGMVYTLHAMCMFSLALYAVCAAYVGFATCICCITCICRIYVVYARSPRQGPHSGGVHRMGWGLGAGLQRVAKGRVRIFRTLRPRPAGLWGRSQLVE